MKNVSLEKTAFEDFEFWAKNDLKMIKKIIDLISDIQKNPFSGKGKPEALRHQYKGYWSRRITDEHRLIYRMTEEAVVIVSVRFHYTD